MKIYTERPPLFPYVKLKVYVGRGHEAWVKDFQTL